MDYLFKLALMFVLTFMARAQQGVYLEPKQYVTADTSRYETFMLKIVNPSDSAVVITNMQTSCGCFLATVQRNVATRDDPGLVYIALTIEQLSREQPTTVDIYTTATGDTPLRLTIWRKGSQP